MKNRLTFRRTAAFLLAFLMLFGVLPLSLCSFAAESLTEPTPPEELGKLSANRVSSETVTDIYGNPVHLHCYADSEKTYSPSITGKDGSVVILYVMNTNTERIGKSSDEEIVRSMLERGYYVVVLDYRDNAVTSPDLDWSIQGIRVQIGSGEIVTPRRDADESNSRSLNYVVPAGYDVAYNVPYFSFDAHGAAGTLERIVEVWNNDFRSVKRDVIVKWTDENGKRKTTKAIADGYDVWYADAAGKTQDNLNGTYTKIGNTWAEDIFDCVRADGSFIDLDLYCDIIYPTGVTEGCPAMILMSSGQTRVNGWSSPTRPQLTGFLFSGYVGVVADYGYVPMARDDHYGYFDGNGRTNSVSGDNGSYSLALYNGVKSDTALVRMLRKLGVDGAVFDGTEKKTLPIDPDRLGVYGNSKAGSCVRLGNPHPELLEDLRHFEGHSGESRLEAYHDETDKYSDPFITDGATNDARIAYPEVQPYLTYDNGGGEIPSNVRLTYAQCGTCWETVVKGNSPIFATGTQKEDGDGAPSYDWFYRNEMNVARSADVPFYGLVAPEAGHNYGNGPDKDYGIDTYYAFHRYANYYLQNGSASCDIIDVDATEDLGIGLTRELDYVYEIGDSSAIRFQFTGPVGREEADKISIVDPLTGESPSGVWTSSFGGQQWKFTPFSIKENTYYRITVPTSILAANGKPLAEEKTLLFRTSGGEGQDAALTERVGNTTYFTFDAADETSYHTELRFTVTNRDARNTLTVETASLAEGESRDSVAKWEPVGEITVIGAGIYTYDVTETLKGKTGRTIFRLVPKYAAGTLAEKTFGFDATTDVTSLGFGRLGFHTIAEVASPEGVDGTMLRIDGNTRTTSWIDLDNHLNGNYIANLGGDASNLIVDTGISNTKLTAADYGRTFRISFKIYDTVSRTILVQMLSDRGGGALDFNNPKRAYTTKAGDFTLIEYDFTIDSLESCTKYDRRSLWISSENKSRITTDPFAAVEANNMADEKNAKPSYYAGTAGLTDEYTYYGYAWQAYRDGKVTPEEGYVRPFYIGALSFREIATAITAENGGLVCRTQNENLLFPTGAVSLDSTDPDAASSEVLTVGGGHQPEDTASKKVYLKLSLADYTAGDAAYFAFTASGGRNRISVFGIADVAGESWTPETVTASNAPANDRYSGGVKLSEVFDGAPLLTVNVTDGQKVTVDISDYAREHKMAGAETLTLILTAREAGEIAVSSQDFEKIANWKVWHSTLGHKTGSGGTTEGLEKDSENGNTYWKITTKKANDGLRLNGLFTGTTPTSDLDDMDWTEKDIGRTFRITFRARTDATSEGNTVTQLQTGMKSAVSRATPYTAAAWYTLAEGETPDAVSYSGNMYQPSDKLAVTDEWQTYTYTFTVDATMLPKEMIAWSGSDPATRTEKSRFTAAISYFAVSPIASDYTAANNTLYVDDVRVTETFGGEEITVTPMTKSDGFAHVRTQDFEKIANWKVWHSTYGHKVGGTTEGLESENGNTYWKITTKQANDGLRLNGLFTGTTPTSDIDDMDWTENDIGRTFRITFRARTDATSEGNTVTQLQAGMKSAASRAKPYTAAAWYTLAEGETPDATSYSGNMYQPSAKLAVTDEWQTYTYTFTVDATMLPKEMIAWSGSDPATRTEKSRFTAAISYFAVSPIASDYTAAGNTLYVDDVRLEEFTEPTAPGATVGLLDLDLEAYNAKSKWGKQISTSGFSWSLNSDTDRVLSQVKDETEGKDAIRFTPFGAGNIVRFTGIFGTEATKWQDNRKWGTDDIGKTYRVTFRAKADRAVSLSYGMMRALDTNLSKEEAEKRNATYYTDATTDPNVYSSNFYGTAGKATFAQADRWYTFTYEFTVEEGMFAKSVYRCADGTKVGDFAVSYFGIKATDYDFGQCDRTVLDGTRPTICLDDVTVREVTGFVGSTLTVNSARTVCGTDVSETLEVRAEPKTGRTNARLTVLPFDTDAARHLTSAELSFALSGADGETLILYLLTGNLPEVLTYESITARLTDRVLTFTAKNGENLVDVTEAVHAYLGQKLTFVLATEDEGDPLTVTTPTLTIGTEKSDFDATAFRVKSNITLASDFLYHAYVPVISALTSLTLDGEALDLATLPTKVIDGTLYYVVTKPIAPKEGAESFTLKATVLADGETKTATYNLSIPTYAAKIVNNNNATYNDTTKTLMRDILSYISAAMTYFDTSTDEAQNTITDIIGENYNAGLTAADVGLDKTGTATDSGKALSTVCLNLEATPSFIFYLKEGKEFLADTFKFTSASGAPLAVTVKKEASGEKRTYLEVTTYAYAMGDLLTFTYTDEEGAQTGTYHLAAYYGGETSDANLSPLLLRLAKYAKSAKAYRESVLKTEGN